MKGQPKGLIAAALANMGERFGFYIMMAILTLFISAKFGLDEATAGYIYSGFYASIYLLALVGGIIADKTKNYKATIMWGLIVMSIGYLLIAIPTPTPVPTPIPGKEIDVSVRKVWQDNRDAAGIRPHTHTDYFWKRSSSWKLITINYFPPHFL